MSWNLKYLILSLLVLIILALINLPFPFCYDQSFFLLGAKEMDKGLILYRDFWDIKQPGIFYFYYYGGKIFGFTLVGIHLFELFYWVLFYFILLWFLQKFQIFKNPELSYIAPLMIVGSYYSFGIPRFFTQVEALVNLPLLAILIINYLFLKTKSYKSMWMLLSGICGGVVLFYKIIFAPIIIVFWLVLFVQFNRDYDYLPIRARLGYFALIPLGILIPWTPFLIYSYNNHLWELCLDTFFILPAKIIEYSEKATLSQLYQAIKGFPLNLSLITPFAIIALLYIKKNNSFFIGMVLWVLIGFIVILMQRTSWFTYHFQIFYTPNIFLALLTTDLILIKLSKITFNTKIHFFLKVLIFILLNFFAIKKTAEKIKTLHNYNYAIKEKDRISLGLTDELNKKAYEASQYLNNQKSENCPIFSIQSPLIYYYTGRIQATSQNGFSIRLLIPEQLDLLLSELKEKKPCYLYVQKSQENYLTSKGEKIIFWINNNYQIATRDIEGTWYKFNY